MATVEWQTSCIDLKQRGALLLETEEWMDCKLLVGCEGAPFRAHKLMLAMASPVFETMFFIENREEQDTFCISDVDPKAFKALINYIYTENISITSYQSAHRLYLAAKKFLILQLARVCAEFMCCNVTVETACTVYDVGNRFQDQQLMVESLQIVKMNIKEILKSKSFEEVHIDTVAAIFGIPDLQVDDMELYQALLRYAAARSSRKRTASPESQETGQVPRSLRHALKNIRFLTFSLEEFAKGPAMSGLLTQEEALSLLVNIAGGDAPMPPGFTDSRQHRYQEALPPAPAPSPPRGTLLVSLAGALACSRSATSPRVLVGGRAWTLRVLCYTETHTGSRYIDNERYLAVFLRCSPNSCAGWSCQVRAELSLLARRRGSSDTSATDSLPRGAIFNKTNKTKIIEKTFTSNQNEWGEKKFATWAEASVESYGYLQDGILTFQAHLTILKTTLAGDTTTTS